MPILSADWDPETAFQKQKNAIKTSFPTLSTIRDEKDLPFKYREYADKMFEIEMPYN